MVIWYLCKYASPQKYFFGTRHFYLGAEWVKNGHEVTVFTSNANHLSDNLPKFEGKFFEEEIEGVKTIWLNGKKAKTSSGLARVLSWLQFEWQLFSLPKKKYSKPDVVIASSLSLLTILNGYWLSKKHKAKFILEIRDIWPLSAMELGGYSKYHPFMFLLAIIEKFGYKNARAIVGTMPNLGAHVEQRIGSKNKVFCIPQGVNLSFYDNQQELDGEYIKKYMPTDKFIICYAGTLNANNPLETLIEAADILKTHPQIHFLIVGNGDRKEFLQTKAKNLSNISFPPPVQKKQVNHLLQYSAVCYDSFSSELAKFGLSRNKWIDYMFAEKPIICSYSGFQSMLNEANSGSFVEYGNAQILAQEILKYYRMDSEEIKRLGRNGKEFLLTNRTFQKLAKQYEEIFVNC